MNPAAAPATTPNDELLAAAQRGDIGGIRVALANGADALDAALIRACERGSAIAVRYLIERGANPNAILPEPNEREPIDDEEDDAWAADPRWPLRHLLVDLVRARKRDVAMALLDGGLSLRRHAFPSWGARLAAQMSKDQELLLALLRAGAWIEGGPIEPGPGFEDRVLAWASNWRNDGLALAIAESGAPLDFEALRRAQRWSFFKIGWRAHPRLRAALDRAGYRPDLWERIRWRARWLFPAILLAPFAFWSMEAFTVFAVVAALFAMGRHSGENAA